MKFGRNLAALLPLLMALGSPAEGQTAMERDLYNDTWVAADALGRKLPTHADTRSPHKDRTVGIFYFLWQGFHGTAGPYDITKITAQPAGQQTWGPLGAFHWWGEPDVGYFRADDPWVIRHNLSMLADAGVDVLMCDVTNAVTYPHEVEALCTTAMQMRAQGNRTPQIAFVAHSYTPETVTKVYNKFYAKNLFPELWFRWQGKPLILGNIDTRFADGRPISQEVKDFFTWRDSWAWEAGKHRWPWIDNTPQKYGWDTDPTVPEEAPVAVASHPTLNIGRSHHDGRQPPLGEHDTAPQVGEGLHFAEQWKRLLEIDPRFAFIDGWNEWVAQRFAVQPGQRMEMLGRPVPTGGSFFVDAFNAEYSRDIEPMRGGYGDNYYFQMVAGIRKFKGVRAPEPASGFKSIHLNGSFHQWDDVRPEYRDAIGDTLHRDWAGWGDLHYKNETGRNDITTARVACDAKTITFYVRTYEALTKYSDPNWMLLLIDADQNASTGWNGYDYIVNAHGIDATTTTVRRVSDGKETRVPYRMAGSELMIAIPRAVIGQTGRTAFDFHWLDNCPIDGDISAFWLYGDSAPDGRFNYRYENSRK